MMISISHSFPHTVTSATFHEWDNSSKYLYNLCVYTASGDNEYAGIGPEVSHRNSKAHQGAKFQVLYYRYFNEFAE